jgi:hypothetical protein
VRGSDSVLSGPERTDGLQSGHDLSLGRLRHGCAGGIRECMCAVWRNAAEHVFTDYNRTL